MAKKLFVFSRIISSTDLQKCEFQETCKIEHSKVDESILEKSNIFHGCGLSDIPVRIADSLINKLLDKINVDDDVYILFHLNQQSDDVVRMLKQRLEEQRKRDKVSFKTINICSFSSMDNAQKYTKITDYYKRVLYGQTEKNEECCEAIITEYFGVKPLEVVLAFLHGCLVEKPDDFDALEKIGFDKNRLQLVGNLGEEKYNISLAALRDELLKKVC
jgi:hypothetical protein